MNRLFAKFSGNFSINLYFKMSIWLLLSLISVLYKKGTLGNQDIETFNSTVDSAILDYHRNGN